MSLLSHTGLTKGRVLYFYSYYELFWVVLLQLCEVHQKGGGLGGIDSQQRGLGQTWSKIKTAASTLKEKVLGWSCGSLFFVSSFYSCMSVLSSWTFSFYLAKYSHVHVVTPVMLCGCTVSFDCAQSHNAFKLQNEALFV